MNDSNFSAEQGPILLAEDLDKVFDTLKEPLQVLSHADVEVKGGEMLGIVGASGVGKSTLLQILGGLDRPTRGRVLFQGVDIYNQKNGFLENFRNVRVGFVFQFFNLLNEFSVMENVMFPALIGNKNPKDAKLRAEQLLVDVGLKERLMHKPGELSGGESQRVALARALINRPQLVLADEPTGNLDSQSAHLLMDIIRKMNQEFNQTFVVVTHSQRLAQNLDRVLQLVGGQLRLIEKALIL